MRSLLVCCALALCIVAVSAQSSPPLFGNEVYIAGTVSLPYAGIVEPFEMFLNGNQARVDYYDGLDTYIFRADLNKTWQVNPMNSVETCFETDGPVNINSYLPNTTGFVLQEDAVQILDQMCDDYQLVVNTLGKISTYDLYVSRETGNTVRYQMMGYDSLIGSHYDLYIVDYTNITIGPSPPGTFDQPQIGNGCGGFPGPGATHMNPLDEMASYYPGNEPTGIVSADYAAYMAAHGKSYSSPQELRTRQMHYQRNLHWVSAHQRRFRIGTESYSVALNFLADHTPDEMASRRGKLKSKKGANPTNNAGSYHERQFSKSSLPTSVDWRTRGAVNRPQDQGICGSCWSFGSTGSIESSYFLKYGKLMVLAEQQLMDCSWNQGNNACDGGEDFRAYDWIMQNGGMNFKKNYGPYLMQDGYCRSGLTPDVVISSYVNVTADDEDALLDAIASVGVISVSIDASHPGLSFYTGGVYYDPACGNTPDALDHSVSAVGYGTDPDGGDYWIVKNSWSTYWGDGGFIKMSRKNNNCGVATAATYTIVE